MSLHVWEPLGTFAPQVSSWRASLASGRFSCAGRSGHYDLEPSCQAVPEEPEAEFQRGVLASVRTKVPHIGIDKSRTDDTARFSFNL